MEAHADAVPLYLMLTNYHDVDTMQGNYAAYAALGFGGHTITILPDLNMVFIHRVDTYAGDRVAPPEINQLLRLLIDAKVGEGSSNPNLIFLPEPSPSAGRVIRGS